MKFKTFLQLKTLLEDRYDDEDYRDSDLPSDERWLKKYTYENLDKWPTDRIVSSLLKKYPYEGGAIYRGINFKDSEQWDKFVDETKDGTVLDAGSITSWTRAAGTANQFALTRPTYFLDRELMQAENQKQKDLDFMIGHAGVILKVALDADVGIDVNKSKYGKEDEIILPPGKYKIELHKKFLPFMKSIDKGNFKHEFMSIATIGGGNDSMDKKKFEHILFHYKEFDDEMKKHLFKLISAVNKDIKYHVEVDSTFDLTKSDGTANRMPRIYVGWNVPGYFFTYYDLILPEDRAIIDGQISKIIDAIDKEYMEKTKTIDWKNTKFETDINRSLVFAAKQGHIHPKFLDHINKSVGAFYNQLNSMDNIRRINKLSGSEQRDAISKFTKDIESMFKNISS